MTAKNQNNQAQAPQQPPPDADRPLTKQLRSVAIKGLVPMLPERGKIKIGRKGPEMTSSGNNKFQPPQKIDHFIVTTLDRAQDGNFKRDEAIHHVLGEKPTDIPVRLLYDDPELNFPTRYAAFIGRVLWCAGDGQVAQRLSNDGKTHQQVQCPCHRQDPAYEGKDKCKINGALGAIIDGVGGIGGVWKFRTTSYNSVVGILSTMNFLRGITGGPLSNIPLTLTVRPKQVSDPRGRQQTIYVVGLEFAGDIASLQQTGHQIALERAKTHLSIELIETEARRLLAAPDHVPLQGDDVEDVVREFYHEEQEAAEADSTQAPPPPKRSDFAGDVIDVTDSGTDAEGAGTPDLDAEFAGVVNGRMPDTPEERGDAPDLTDHSDAGDEPPPTDQKKESLIFIWTNEVGKNLVQVKCETPQAWIAAARASLGERFEARKPLKVAWDFNYPQWQAVMAAIPKDKDGQLMIDEMHIHLDELLTAEKDRRA